MLMNGFDVALLWKVAHGRLRRESGSKRRGISKRSPLSAKRISSHGQGATLELIVGEVVIPEANRQGRHVLGDLLGSGLSSRDLEVGRLCGHPSHPEAKLECLRFLEDGNWNLPPGNRIALQEVRCDEFLLV